MCLCIASCASVHCKVCVLSFGSGVPPHCNFMCASALQVMHSYSVVVCVCGSGVNALVVVIPRISQVVGGFNLCKG